MCIGRLTFSERIPIICCSTRPPLEGALSTDLLCQAQHGPPRPFAPLVLMIVPDGRENERWVVILVILSFFFFSNFPYMLSFYPLHIRSAIRASWRETHPAPIWSIKVLSESQAKAALVNHLEMKGEARQENILKTMQEAPR